MLLNRGRRISREAVIEAMWGGAAPSTARSQVHNAVTVIRAHLAELGAPEVLDSGPSGYELLVEPEQVDISRFDDGVRLARDAAVRGGPRRRRGCCAARWGCGAASRSRTPPARSWKRPGRGSWSGG
ncbi:AfsR/SARP family transcriptional regulator [Phytohabitans houttuyneae]|nr:hypothetical protein [Phytohabitans houttuyneae]